MVGRRLGSQVFRGSRRNEVEEPTSLRVFLRAMLQGVRNREEVNSGSRCSLAGPQWDRGIFCHTQRNSSRPSCAWPWSKCGWRLTFIGRKEATRKTGQRLIKSTIPATGAILAPSMGGLTSKRNQTFYTTEGVGTCCPDWRYHVSGSFHTVDERRGREHEEAGTVALANLVVCWAAWENSTHRRSTRSGTQKATSRISGRLQMFSKSSPLITGIRHSCQDFDFCK